MAKRSTKEQLLYLSARDGLVDEVSACLADGVDPDHLTGYKYGITPLMAACRSGEYPCVKVLVEHGANVNAVDKEKNTVLMHACSENVNPKIVAYLLPRIHAVNCKNAYGHTALMLAAANDNPKVVRLLIEHGAEVNVVSDNQETALTFAVVWGQIKVVKELLKANVDINWIDEHGWTPLKYALYEKRWDIANLLHDHGAILAPLKSGSKQVGKRAASKAKSV